MIRTLASALALASILALSTLANAAQVAAPTGEVILTVSGAIDANGTDSADFDLAMLEAMPKESFSTNTPWFDGPVEFEGVGLDTLIESLDGKGTTIVAVALNDYASDLPIADIAKHGAILAYKRDGQYMEVSDKGPLFIVYPFDSSTELQTQLYYQQAVWQVRELIVK